MNCLNHFRVLSFAALLMCASTWTSAQATPSTAQTPAPSASPRIHIGPGDLLEVKVFNAPEMVQSVRVDDLGDATLALVGQIHLEGLTVRQSQQLIAQRYKEGHFFLHPEVSVLIQEYSTQGVSVLGEVTKPGVYPVLGRRSLLDIIAEAGGITPTAGSEATIQRHTDGSIQSVRLSNDARTSLTSDIEIQPEDKVIISRAAIVYVIGNVNHPGGFVMANAGTISIIQALAMAEGSNSTASLDRTMLIRKTKSGYIENAVHLKKILKGKENDQQMQAEDILYIPNSAGKSVLYRGMPGAIEAVSSAAIYRSY